MTRLRYSEGSDAPGDARAARTAADEIVRACHAQVGRPRVVGDAIDPRTLFAR